jgi:hypothetical protein
VSGAELLLALVLGAPLAQARAAGGDAAILREAKAALFDHDWDAAAAECEALVSRFPRSPLVGQARFYLARAHEGSGRDEQALAAYDLFLSHHAELQEMRQHARTATLGLARKLVDGGQGQYWGRLREGLEDPSREVRAYAAIQVSALSDKRKAREAIPVLVDMVRGEVSRDLQDRARIALLRLDPEVLRTAEEQRPPTPAARRSRAPAADREPRLIRIRVFQRGSREAIVDLRLPLALGELAFRALSEDSRRSLRRQKGIDLENFWSELKKLGRHKILGIEGEDERVEIWVE